MSFFFLGDELLWLNATDHDGDDLQFGVEGDFYKKLILVKKIERNRAVVIAKQVFDREVKKRFSKNLQLRFFLYFNLKI